MPKTIYLSAAEPLSNDVVLAQVNIVEELPEFEDLDAARKFYEDQATA